MGELTGHREAAESRPAPGPTERVVPGPGQESVWDYPRPPRVEAVPERLRVIVDGEVLVTIGSDRRHLRVGDVCVMNRGVEHELYSKSGVTFFEALAPVPLDHVPDRDRDLVLGPEGGSQHVER